MSPVCNQCCNRGCNGCPCPLNGECTNCEAYIRKGSDPMLCDECEDELDAEEEREDAREERRGRIREWLQ